jgi:hypothetical protein
MSSAELTRTVETLFSPGDVVELRTFKDGATFSGYFDDHAELVKAAAKHDERGHDVYITLNKLPEQIASRRYNRIERMKGRDASTSDKDVERRTHLFIDNDCKRVSGISSTDEEKEKARRQAREIRDYLGEQGWPDPIVGDSGNGHHLLYPIDLPADQAGLELVAGVLEALDFKFSDDSVEVDTTTKNAARITKFYGTVAKKGDDLPRRPHRPSKLLEIPDKPATVNREQLAKVAAMKPEEPRKFHVYSGGNGRQPFDLVDWIGRYDVPVKREGPWKNGGWRYILQECPWNGHADSAAYIVQQPTGEIGAGCHHNSCKGYKWQDLRTHYEPDAYDRNDGNGSTSTNPTNPANSTNPTNSANPTNRTQPMTAGELMGLTFEPTRWVVPDVLPEGLSLLVGKPKKGKSWMALGLCEAVAAGGVAFGTRRVEQGDTLYLALEDSYKRLQKRLKKVLGSAPAPERMHLHTEWPRLDEGGAELLDEWLTEHPEARLVVIDTLAKIRQPARGANVYAEDYAALEKLLPLAAKHGVAIVVVHHLRKMAASDPMDEISSSTGLTAGVDGFLILRRTPGSKGPTLYVDGRDIEEPTEYALHWNHNTATWTIEGDAEEVRLSKERADILLTLNRSPSPLTPKEVSDMMPGAKYNNVKYLMWAMLGDGQLVKDDRGRYSPANPTNPPHPTNSTNSTNPASERVAAVSGLVDAPAPPNPTFPDTYAENGDTVSGVSGVSGDGAHPLHTPDEESW